MKRFFKHGIQEKYLIIIAITSVLLFVGGASYALFTMHLEYGDKFGITTGTLEGELKVDGNLTDQLVVSQGETKEFTVTLKNINDRTARYLLYYIGPLPEGLEVGYTSDGSVPPEENGRNIASEVTETYIIKVKNTTTSSQTVQLQLDSGLEHIDLTLPGNGHLFEEMQGVNGAELFLVDHANDESAEFDTSNADNPVNHKMFVFHHEAGVQQEGWSEEELTDYRYIGADPNNYVTFNGEEAGWRIIGIFTVENEKGEKEKRIKIMKADSMGSIAWDTGRRNNWTNASLMKAINSDTGETTYNWTESGKRLIGNTKWYLGGRVDTYAISSQFYKDERGIKTCQTVGDCDPDIDIPTYWKGKVGLMYPSDYGYATSGGSTTNREACLTEKMNNWDNQAVSDCKNNDWIYRSINPTSNNVAQWTLSPYSEVADRTFVVTTSGDVSDNYRVTDTYAVRPVVYLVSDIQYLKGSGSKESPFVFTK